MHKARPLLIVVALIVAAGLAPQGTCGTIGAGVMALLPPAPIVTISGRVLATGGRPGSQTVVTLIPIARESETVVPAQRTTQTDVQGNFLIRGVLPGAYLVLAKLEQDTREYWAEQRVEVGDSDVTGLQLQLQGAMNLSGKVSAAGGSNPDLHNMQIRLTPADGNSPSVTAEIDKDGKFTLLEVRPTVQRVQLSTLPEGWYLRSAVVGQQDVLNHGLKLGEGEAGSSLDITISSGTATLLGVVLDPEYRDTVPHAVVKLFPDPPNPYRADLFRSASTDRDGHFTIANVVPGAYRVLTIMGKSDGGYDDSLTAAAAGVRITLGEKQSKRVELEIFEAHR